VSISIVVPIRMAWQALMEVLNRTPSPQLLEEVTQIVRECTADLPVQELFVRVIQPGRTRMVAAHVVLPDDFTVGGLAAFDAIRHKTEDRLKQDHASTVLDLLFTADPRWGVPASEAAADDDTPRADGDD
jgi:predicted Co/Zn/Cd cation transporter (cation efflux family)